jgi:hypothetical protein
MNVRMFGSFDGIPEMAKTPRKTPQRGWSPAIGSRTRGEDAKQVKCLIASAGHEWMVGYFDRLPAPVRHRLAQRRHNICAACLTEEAWRREPRPRVATFIRVLLEIERQLDAPSSAGERGSGRKPGPAGL